MAISISLLQDFDSASSAACALRDDIGRRLAQYKPGQTEYLIHSLTLELTAILGRLQREIENSACSIPKGWAIFPFNAPSQFVIADDFGGKIMVRRYAHDALVIVDRDLFLLIVSFLFFQSRPDPYGPILAAWMFLHASIHLDQRFPLLEVFYLFAVRQNRVLINDLCRSVGFFFLAHELGHSYMRKHGNEYVRARTFDAVQLQKFKSSVSSLRLHGDGAIYNVLDDGAPPPLLVIPKENASWLDELAADLYACYLHIVPYAQQPERGLESLVNQLSVWQQILRLLDLRQHHHARGQIQSHPHTTIRMDSMVHHFEKLCLEFGPEFRSSSLTILQRQYEKTWSKSFFNVWNDACEYAFYTTDSHRAGGPDGPIFLGLFRRFLEQCAAPAASLLGKISDREAEIEWGKQLGEYTMTFKMGDRSVLTDLAEQIRGIGLEFVES